MLMLSPSGGDSFTGPTGTAYTGTTGNSNEIAQGDLVTALYRGWLPQPYGPDIDIRVPLTGFNLTIPDTASIFVLNPAGTLATGTVKMPPNPLPRRIINVLTTQTITSCTFSANTGQTISGNPTTLTALAPMEFIYVDALSKWMQR